jgi:aryl carrier-like protein
VTEQHDLVIGSPMANRTRPETQGLIGLFTNMVPLRSQLAPDLTWRQLLKRARAATLDAYAHQSLPFEELVKAVQPTRFPGASPCFQVAFSFRQQDQESLCLPGIAVKTLELLNSTSKFDLTLHMQLTPERFGGTFIYSAALFDEATIERLGASMQGALEHLLTHPDAQLASMPLPAQRHSDRPHTAEPLEKTPPAQEVGPANALEQIIVEIWQNVLGAPEVGVQDNFFDLGGYSLLMIQVQRQLQETLQIQIALPDLFRAPTIQSLADFLRHGFDEASMLVQQRERGRARDEALSQQRNRRQAQRARQGGGHD